MATGLGSAGANTALNAWGAAYPWIKLHVGDPGANGTANPATETTRKQATWAAAASGSMATSALLTWTAVAGTEDYTYWTAWTASTAGTFGGSGTVIADSVNAGDTFQVAIGDLVVSFTVAS